MADTKNTQEPEIYSCTRCNCNVNINEDPDSLTPADENGDVWVICMACRFMDEEIPLNEEEENLVSEAYAEEEKKK